MVAPWSRYKATLLFKRIVTDRYDPAVKNTVPPPAAAAASIVLLMAGGSSLLPLPAAPKPRTLSPNAGTAFGHDCFEGVRRLLFCALVVTAPNCQPMEDKHET